MRLSTEGKLPKEIRVFFGGRQVCGLMRFPFGNAQPRKSGCQQAKRVQQPVRLLDDGRVACESYPVISNVGCCVGGSGCPSQKASRILVFLHKLRRWRCNATIEFASFEHGRASMANGRDTSCARWVSTCTLMIGHCACAISIRMAFFNS